MKIKSWIDRKLFDLGTWLIVRNPITTATAYQISSKVNKMRCDHCGLNPIHYLDDCDCKK